jgi:hypothetical protein
MILISYKNSFLGMNVKLRVLSYGKGGKKKRFCMILWLISEMVLMSINLTISLGIVTFWAFPKALTLSDLCLLPGALHSYSIVYK